MDGVSWVVLSSLPLLKSWLKLILISIEINICRHNLGCNLIRMKGEAKGPSQLIEEILRDIYKNQQGFTVKTSVHLRRI